MDQTAAAITPREALAERFLELVPRLKRRFAGTLRPEVRDQLAQATAHQIEALCALAGSADGLTMHDLARRQGVALSTATALADRLLKQGMVERRDDPTDRRVVRLVPTAMAERFMAGFVEDRRQSAIAVLASLDDGEVEQLLALVEKIAIPPPAGTL